MSKLSFNQTSIAIEYLINPVGTKRKAHRGSVEDIKNFYIATESISNEGIGSSINAAFKRLVKLILDLITRIKNKVLSKIKNIKPLTKEDNDLLKPFITNILIPIKDIFRKIDKEQLSVSTRNEVVNNFIEDELTAMGYTGDLYDLTSCIKSLCNFTYTDWHMGVLGKLNCDELIYKLDTFANGLKVGPNDEKIIAAYDNAFSVKPGDNVENYHLNWYNEPSATAILILYKAAGVNTNQIENHFDEVARQYSSGEISKFVATSPDNALYKKGVDAINKLEAVTKKIYANDLEGISQETKLRVWTVTTLINQFSAALGNMLSIPNLYSEILKAAEANKKSESK